MSAASRPSRKPIRKLASISPSSRRYLVAALDERVIAVGSIGEARLT